jgi:hypothetical protein
MVGKSLGVFSIDSGFRRLLYRIVNSAHFNLSVIVIIIINAIILAASTPIKDPNSIVSQVLLATEDITLFFFFFEIVVKIIAFGLLTNGKESYLKNVWNSFDFVLGICTLPYLCGVTHSDNLFLKSISLFRLFKPLRLITKNQRLQLAVSSLYHAKGDIMRALFISLMF